MYLETSAVDGKNVEELFEEVAKKHLVNLSKAKKSDLIPDTVDGVQKDKFDLNK